MQKILVLLLVLAPACLAVVGCGSKPDPRDRPDFVDTSTNPSAAADALNADRPANAPAPKP
jgi:hypothetical protein